MNTLTSQLLEAPVCPAQAANFLHETAKQKMGLKDHMVRDHVLDDDGEQVSPVPIEATSCFDSSELFVSMCSIFMFGVGRPCKTEELITH